MESQSTRLNETVIATLDLLQKQIVALEARVYTLESQIATVLSVEDSARHQETLKQILRGEIDMPKKTT